MTDTPVKNHIEEEKNKSAAKKKPKKKRKIQVDSDDSDAEEQEMAVPVESDDESAGEDEIHEHEQIVKGRYVVVKYIKKTRSNFFVARVDDIGENGDIMVTYYKRSGEGFILPEEEESDIVKQDDISRCLPGPIMAGGTTRSALKLRFPTDLSEVSW